MRLPSGSDEKIVVDGEIFRWADQSNTVARRIDFASGDDGVLPITPRDRVVAGVKLAIDDIDIVTPAIGRAAPMNAIPAADDFQIPKFHVVTVHEIDRVVRRIDDGEIAKMHVVTIHEIES